MKFRLEGQEIAPPVRSCKSRTLTFPSPFDLDAIGEVCRKVCRRHLNGTVEVFRANENRQRHVCLNLWRPMPPSSNQAVDRWPIQISMRKLTIRPTRKVARRFYSMKRTITFTPRPDVTSHSPISSPTMVTRSSQTSRNFLPTALKGYRILVISNALGAARMNDAAAGNAAFTEAESDAVRDWVRGGGSLLLIADHAPMGSANQILGQRFGVDMSKMYTVDPQNSDQNLGIRASSFTRARVAGWPTIRSRAAATQANESTK